MPDFVSPAWMPSSRRAVTEWATGHEPGSHGSHTYDLTDFGIDADADRARFASYLTAFPPTD